MAWWSPTYERGRCRYCGRFIAKNNLARASHAKACRRRRRERAQARLAEEHAARLAKKAQEAAP